MVENHWADDASDEDLRKGMKEIDDLDNVRVDSSEAKLIETLVYRNQTAKWTDKQRTAAVKMVRRYLD